MTTQTKKTERAAETNPADELAGLAVGRLVHYVLIDGPNAGKSRPAIVVRVWERGCVNLQLFTDGPNDGNRYAAGRSWQTSVNYSPTGELGTWHWPPRD